jgi:probable rRNA maturation factor
MLKQAKEYQVTPLEELQRLLVHGFLHLLGYDHENVSKTEAQKMVKEEKRLRKIIAKLNS